MTTSQFPSVLFHYTNSAAFASIVEKRTLWLGSRWHLNDSDEGAAFGRHLRQLAGGAAKGDKRVEMIMGALQAHEMFVTCFSTDGDLLSQWRGYADNGAGVAIGLRREVLVSAIKSSRSVLLKDVIYADDPTGLPDDLRKLLSSLLTSTGEPGGDFLQSVAKERWRVKSRAFAEELEYRLILTPAADDDEIALMGGAKAIRRFRSIGSDLREYYDLVLPPAERSDAIAEVVLGPRNRSEESVVRRFLHASGFPDATVRRSSASYR